MTRIIAHLDMDAFFASVEERDQPWLSGEPLVVGADPEGGEGRGVVSTANYAARKYGIRSAMPITEAWRRSEDAKKEGKPPVIFLTPAFSRYGDTSRRVMAIARKYCSDMEEAGVDESYLDMSQYDTFAKAEDACRKLKEEIREKEHITASIGLGPNKLVAKIASDEDKPDGLTIVTLSEVLKFLAKHPVRALPGVGPKTGMRLARKNIHTIADLLEMSEAALVEMFGKWGSVLYARARGDDDRELTHPEAAKSVGEQTTFSRDTLDPNIIFPAISECVNGLMRRLKREGFSSFRTIVVIVRFSGFVTKTRSHTGTMPLKNITEVEQAALRMVTPFLDARENPRHKKLRLVGVRAEKLLA